MDEKRVREICTGILVGTTYEEMREADIWLKKYALARLDIYLSNAVELDLREYVMTMARSNYGSLETHNLLEMYGCYPKWLKFAPVVGI